MTGLSEAEHVVEGLASGGVDYVRKPIVLVELLARIRVHLGNARLANETHAALDASGRFLFATDRMGPLLWRTPKARQLLCGVDAARAAEAGLPADVVEQLLRLRRADTQAARSVVARGRRLDCSFLSTLGADELLFRLAETASPDEERSALQRAHGVTAREAEVPGPHPFF